jgi:CRP-like cAMP-binding protein
MHATAARTQDRPATRLAQPLPATEEDAGDDLAAFDSVGTVVSLRRDAVLFREGDAARYCYKVLTGAVRACRLLHDGRRSISEFLLPGDFIGLEAEGTYRFAAEAVSDVTLMRYSLQAVDRLIQQSPRLGRRLLGLVWSDISAAQAQMLLLGRKNAVERLASFLLMMAERNGGADCVRLPMTRNDIADNLGLTTETVSRVFGQFKRQGLIQLRASSAVVLRNRDGLEALAEAA